jgi:tRNA pseudouridine65 synthase
MNPQRMHIPIIYQDEHLLVVYKPSGLLVHRSPIDKTETQFLMQLVRDQIAQRVYTVHRLDKPTSGLLLLALSSEVAKRLSLQLERQQVSKTYIALIRGWLTQAQRLDYPLIEQLDKMTDNMRKDNPAKAAVTNITPLAHFELPYPIARYQTGRFSLVELMPETGRKHQLRRHMKHLLHPIIGDTTHGDAKQNRYMQTHVGIERLALCATALALAHPVSGEPLNVRVGLDRTLDGIVSMFEQNLMWQAEDFSQESLI